MVTTHTRLVFGVLLGLTVSLLVRAAPATAGPGAGAPDASVRPEQRAAPSLRRAARWIVDERGRVVISHGFNVIQKPAPFYPTRFGADDVDFMVRNGMTTARIGFIWAGVEPRPGEYDDAYIDRVIALNDLLASRGIRTVIDFHQDAWNDGNGGDGAAAWATLGAPVPLGLDHFRTFWHDEPAPDGVGIQTHFVRMWGYVAAKLDASKGADNILGYDPFNEPYPGSDTGCVPFVSACPAWEAGALTTFYRRVIASIRAVGDHHVVWVEGPPTQGATPALGALGDPHVAYHFHQYCPAALAGGVAGLPDTSGTPLAATCAPVEESTLAAYDAYARGRSMPAYLGEFGCSDDADDTAQFVDIAGRRLMSWAVWTYYTQDCRGILADETKPASDATAKQAKLSALAVPYAQLTAGTPLAYDFDRSTRTMTYSYTTRGASPARSPRTALTQIFVPRRHYPHGYRVQVTGARVVSDPTSPYVLLAREAGARRVSVRLAPASGSRTRVPTRSVRPHRPTATRIRTTLSRAVRGGTAATLRYRVVGARPSDTVAGVVEVRVDGSRVRRYDAPVMGRARGRGAGFLLRLPPGLRPGRHTVRVSFLADPGSGYRDASSHPMTVTVGEAS